uniref:Defensin 4 n=1 Tax=Allium cepa TaxID=4679 RepID=A0A7D5NHE1_ALLCE|nr:defensin 4 [Allium cepa]
MGLFKCFLSAILLFILLSATDMTPATMVEARTCLSQSHKFKGKCFSGTNCANVCKTEGFPSGQCQGFRRRCFCSTNC